MRSGVGSKESAPSLLATLDRTIVTELALYAVMAVEESGRLMTPPFVLPAQGELVELVVGEDASRMQVELGGRDQRLAATLAVLDPLVGREEFVGDVDLDHGVAVGAWGSETRFVVGERRQLADR
jgi:hypothetical protein